MARSATLRSLNNRCWAASVRFRYNCAVALQPSATVTVPNSPAPVLALVLLLSLAACRWIAPYGPAPAADANVEFLVGDGDIPPPPPPDAKPDAPGERPRCPSDPNDLWKIPETPICNDTDSYCLVHPLLQGHTLLAVGGTCYEQHYAVGNKETVLIGDGQRWFPLQRLFQNDDLNYHAIWGYDGDNTFVVGSSGTVLRLRGKQQTILTAPMQFSYWLGGQLTKNDSPELTGVWGNHERLFVTTAKGKLCSASIPAALEINTIPEYQCTNLDKKINGISGMGSRMVLVGERLIIVVRDSYKELNDANLVVPENGAQWDLNAVVFADERWAFAVGAGTELIRIDTDNGGKAETVKLHGATDQDTPFDDFASDSIEWTSISKNDEFLFLGGHSKGDKAGHSLIVQIPLDSARKEGSVTPKLIWDDKTGSPIQGLHYLMPTNGEQTGEASPPNLLYAVGKGGLLLRNDTEGNAIDPQKWTQQGGLISWPAASQVVDLWRDDNQLAALTENGTLITAKRASEHIFEWQHLGSTGPDAISLVGIAPPAPMQFNYVFSNLKGLSYCSGNANDCTDKIMELTVGDTVYDLFSDGTSNILAGGEKGQYGRITASADSVTPIDSDFNFVSSEHEYRGVWPGDDERIVLVGTKSSSTGIVTSVETNGVHTSTMLTAKAEPLENLVAVWGAKADPPSLYALSAALSLYEVSLIKDPSADTTASIPIKMRLEGISSNMTGAALVGRNLKVVSSDDLTSPVELFMVDGTSSVVYRWKSNGGPQEWTLEKVGAGETLTAVSILHDYTYVAGENGRIYRKKTQH